MSPTGFDLNHLEFVRVYRFVLKMKCGEIKTKRRTRRERFYGNVWNEKENVTSPTQASPLASRKSFLQRFLGHWRIRSGASTLSARPKTWSIVVSVSRVKHFYAWKTSFHSTKSKRCSLSEFAQNVHCTLLTNRRTALFQRKIHLKVPRIKIAALDKTLFCWPLFMLLAYKIFLVRFALILFLQPKLEKAGF